jgi:hypothetical protein
MKTQTEEQKQNDQTALSVAIGYEVSQLLNLKFGKDGRTKTSWGTKTVQGIGACIQRIVEEETEKRLK